MVNAKKPFEATTMVEYVIIAVVTVVSAFGAVFGHGQLYPPRDDPWTKTQDIASRKVSEGNLEVLMSQMADLKIEMGKLRAHDAAMIQTLHEIALSIGDLPPKDWQNRIRDTERWIDRHDHPDR